MSEVPRVDPSFDVRELPRLWESSYWDALESRLGAAGAPEEGIARDHHLRVVAPVAEYMCSGQHPGRREHVVARAHEVVTAHVSPDQDASLPGPLRLWAWLLREHRTPLLQELARLDAGRTASTTVDAAWWDGAALRLRATTRWSGPDGAPLALHSTAGRLYRVLPSSFEDVPGEMLDVTDAVDAATTKLAVRHLGKRLEWPVVSRSVVVHEPMVPPVAGAAPADPTDIGVAISTTADLAPLRLADGRPLPRGRWGLVAESMGFGFTTRGPVLAALPARPALVGGRTMVARSSPPEGQLQLVVEQADRSLLDDIEPDWSRSSIVSARDGVRQDHTIRVPLSGLHVDAATRLTGTVSIEPVRGSRRSVRSAVLRRYGRVVTRPGTVTLEGTHSGTELQLQVPTPVRGRWTVRPRLSNGPTAQGWEIPPPVGPASAPETAPDNAATPADVTVIIPAYNVEDYIEECIRSVFAQTLPSERVEILVVDDGSTDDTLLRLEKLAPEHPRMRVVSQPNSGSASRPRNVALDRATGRYIFCLDADDMLTPWALERLVDTADSTGSDVVLGKIQGINGHGQPSKTFQRTVLDADLARDHLFHAMTPHKLFRREHLETIQLRFHEDMSVGEDVIFVAEAELTARKISILADDAYYQWRQRTDTTEHMSKSGAGFEGIYVKASRLAALIEKHVEPGPRREALMRRVYRYVYHGMLRNLALETDDERRAENAARVRETFGPLWSDGSRAHLPTHLSLPLELLFAGHVDDAIAVARQVRGDVRRLRYVIEEDRVVVGLGDGLAERIPLEWRLAPRATSTAVLNGIETSHGAVVVRADVAGWKIRTTPDRVVATLERAARALGEAIVLPVEVLGSSTPGTLSIAVTVNSEALTDHRGTWHLVVRPVWGALEGEPVRVGREIADSVPEDSVTVLDASTQVRRNAKGALVVRRTA
ncbi:glycosyltransferase family 2 protein [Isoptericola sp. 178]|uniref:glycosyltransferase family 2 protein n=1 Tax=Isoptericola sp. 178 TaxID=3064651 RepID=UPI002712EA81|nr:glycosyltransferase family 2 protein [Isoptericola sp. 178]MDO8144124.1 glycosyltransferase family 2 protein [Isoptericola sp. 178]